MFLARCTDNIYTVDRLSPGSSHRFRVSAENAIGRGTSIESKKVTLSAETALCMEKPTAISSAGSIIAMWKRLPDDDVNYIVEIKEANSRRSWKAVSAEPVQGDSYTISGLNPGSEYIVRVTAVTSESQGTPSEQSEIVKFEDVRGLLLELNFASRILDNVSEIGSAP
ncbi:fibronectin type III domain protein [Cooperia oncophora]